ncbi:MAG: AAA family ATPase [Anaerolineaceae bacterium 4572_78]|nr:MAG: AAA family ATPase [Anaerolineaceae bacterium 4572_78]
MKQAYALTQKLFGNVRQVIIGKDEAIKKTILALLVQGHVLIEDVPGVGKTILARAIAKSIGCSFKRIQFTPDMLPSDVTGVSVFNQKTREFDFREGPIFAQIVLVDEINRATPKTQSALLEAMEERQVTVDGTTYIMPKPFLVLATQNPIEYEGTFPLPEAQLDRFVLRIRLGYVSKEKEIQILTDQQFKHPLDNLMGAISRQDLIEMQDAVKQVHVEESIKEYIVDITNATRNHPDVYLGASPRGSLGLYKTSQASAVITGRDYVIPDDIKSLAEPVLAHRLIISPAARMKNVNAEHVINRILEMVAVPSATR